MLKKILDYTPGIKMPNKAVGYIPLGSYLASCNKINYATIGAIITSGKVCNMCPTMVSNDPLTAEADAIQFYAHLKGVRNLPERVVVQEWGIGNGRFALDFLRKLGGLDIAGGTNYLERIKYVLVDFSSSIIAYARYNLKGFERNTEFVKFDLSEDINIYKGETIYIRSNELYDDLPGIIDLKKQGDTYYMGYVLPGADRNPIRPGNGGNIEYKKIDINDLPLGPMIDSYFKHYQLEHDLINVGAVQSIINAHSLLSPQGYIQIFDYAAREPGRSRIRWTDWRQPTSDVNFHFLIYALQYYGYPAPVFQQQEEYLSLIHKDRYFIAPPEDDLPERPASSSDPYYMACFDALMGIAKRTEGKYWFKEVEIFEAFRAITKDDFKALELLGILTK